MIRMFLFAAGFFAITIALIVFQPGSTRNAPRPVPEPVTRAEPALSPQAPTTATSTALGAEYTRALAEPVPRPATPAPRTAAAASDLDDQSLRRMTWDTLSNINRATGKEAAPGQPGSVLHTIVRRSLDEAPTGARIQQDTTDSRSGMPNIYVVQPGDSLVTIADKIYGDVNMTGPLFAANQAILTRPDDLRAGQTLVLPAQ